MGVYRLPLALLVLASTQTPQASADFIVPGTAGPGAFVTVGHFDGGTLLELTSSGSIELVGGTGFTWQTFADGSLAAPVTFPAYLYANVGATGYPTVGGGDGVNHFPGGGANYDTALVPPNGPYGIAGTQTTDTLTAGVIRFGSVIGTFADSPTRDDWFLVGLGTTVVAPDGGGVLRLAVNDGNNANNLGHYTVDVQVVPVPASVTLLIVGGLSMAGVGFCRKRRRA